MSYLFKYLRHGSAVKRLTPRRIANCLRLALELKTRQETVRSYPVVARINTCPICHLNCLACREISRTSVSRAKDAMSLELYREVIDQLADYLLLAVLYDEGEPLLNPELPEIVRYTGLLNISTSVSSSLSIDCSESYLRDLVASGLDRITVSIDGSTQETYRRYREGGDLLLVQENLRRLLSLKQELKAPLQVEVQFLELGFNDHEAPEVRALAANLGADSFRSLPTSPSGLERYLAGRGLTMGAEEHLRLGCLDLYAIAHIDSGGLLYPCDFGEDNGMLPLGDLLRDDFRSLWNGAYLRRMRGAFSRGCRDLACGVCRRCPSANRVPLFLR